MTCGSCYQQLAICAPVSISDDDKRWLLDAQRRKDELGKLYNQQKILMNLAFFFHLLNYNAS